MGLKYGLPTGSFIDIVRIISEFDHVDKAVLYGSRAMGTEREGSDIDIAIYGSKLSFDEFLSLKIALEELDLLYELDIVRFETITNPDFIEHIKRVGVEIFKRNN